MKKIIKYFVFVLPILLWSCEDYLENKPTASLDPSKIDESKFEQLRNSFYTNLEGSEIVFTEGYVDNAYSRNPWDSDGGLIQQNMINGGTGLIYNLYGSIRECNLFIELAEQMQNVDPAIKSKYIAEAKVMRAWIYAKLTLYYGDIPLITETVKELPGGIAQTDKTKIYEFVLKELQDASDILPKDNDLNCFNKYSALALKARFAYYFGEYSQAEKAAKTVISEGGYSLFKGEVKDENIELDKKFFASLVDFDAYGIDKEKFLNGIFTYRYIWHTDMLDNSEVIISKEYQAHEKYGNFVPYAVLLPANMCDRAAYATLVPIQPLVDAYWTLDNKKPSLASAQDRSTQWHELTNEILEKVKTEKTFDAAIESLGDEFYNKPYLNQYKNRDARLYASILFPFTTTKDFNINDFKSHYWKFDRQEVNLNMGKSGFAFAKISGAKDVAGIYENQYYTSGEDLPLVRLAEMLLIYAESHTQTTSYDGTVTAELNKLRDRVGMPHVPEGLDKTEAINFIRNERRIELAGEGLRFYDIRLYEDEARNNGIKGEDAASKVMNEQVIDPTGGNSALLTWDKRLLYMPKPYDALNKNPQLKPTPGY